MFIALLVNQRANEQGKLYRKKPFTYLYVDGFFVIRIFIDRFGTIKNLNFLYFICF